MIFDRVILELQSQLTNDKAERSDYHLTDLFRNLKIIDETGESQTSLAMSPQDIQIIEDLRRRGVSCHLNKTESSLVKR